MTRYFTDGVTEEVISTVSKIPKLTVISRTSAMKYKNSNKSTTEIGREAQRRKNSGRERKEIRQQIKNYNTGNRFGQRHVHLWSSSYDKRLEDIFAIQSEIAERVASALEIKLFSKEKEEIEDNLPTKSKEAFTLFLKGRYYLNERRREAIDKAVKYLRKGNRS